MAGRTITIHIHDTPDGVAVLTSAAQPIAGAPLSPAQALAADVLAVCARRAGAISYWQGKDPAMSLVRELIDPEGYGWAVSPEVRRSAARVLGVRLVGEP